jgi:hypothetical protein
LRWWNIRLSLARLNVAGDLLFDASLILGRATTHFIRMAATCGAGASAAKGFKPLIPGMALPILVEP